MAEWKEEAGDQLDRTARQTRLPGGEVHKLTANTFDPADGRRYRTSCTLTLTGAAGAMLTTRNVTCTWCREGRVAGSRTVTPAQLQDIT